MATFRERHAIRIYPFGFKPSLDSINGFWLGSKYVDYLFVCPVFAVVDRLGVGNGIDKLLGSMKVRLRQTDSYRQCPEAVKTSCSCPACPSNGPFLVNNMVDCPFRRLCLCGYHQGNQQTGQHSKPHYHKPNDTSSAREEAQGTEVEVSGLYIEP
jgi:hypothetical protein